LRLMLWGMDETSGSSRVPRSGARQRRRTSGGGPEGVSAQRE